MKYIFFILLSFNALSQDESCIAIEENEFQNQVHKLLEWFGAVDNQVEKAPCKVKSVPTMAEMQKFIASKTKGTPTSSSVNGMNINGESPALIEAFKDFTTAKDTFGIYAVIPNQKQIQTYFKIPADCDKVMCAMEKIWGKEYATKLLYLKLKHNFNSSELAFENSDRFTDSEINDVIIGLEDLPAHLTPLGTNNNQRLTHFKRGYTLKQYEGTTLANAVVMLFDPWDKKSNLTKQYTVFHEMSHNISGKLKDMDESPEWLRLSGWIKMGDDWKSNTGACLASRYGETNPWEDYAESLSAFRYNGAQFKAKCPEKFEFIKNRVFRGIDYTDVKNCTQVPSEKVQLAQKDIVDEIMKSVGQVQFDEKELTESCDKGFTSYPISENELTSCSLKLHSVKALTGNNSKISEILAKAGIPDTAANRDLVLSGVMEGFTEEMMKDIALRSIAVSDKIEEIVKKSFLASNPEGFAKKDIKADDYRFRNSIKECGIGFFSSELEKVKECQLKALISQDREFQRWDIGVFPPYKSPSLFSGDMQSLVFKREEALLSHISKQPLAEEMIQTENRRYQEDMKYHLTTIQLKLYNLPKWKSMTPQDFCKETYGGGTSWTEQYGVNAGQTIPKLYDACVSEQAKKSKRFEFKEDQWASIVAK